MLDNDNEYGIDESAVLTLAELFYEVGFPEQKALDMAWGVAILPFIIPDF